MARETTIKDILSKSVEKIRDFMPLQFQAETEEKIVFYLRLYTEINSAFTFLKANDYENFAYHAKRAKRFSGGCRFRPEKAYADRINGNMNIVLKIREKSKEDPHRVNSLLDSSRTICIIRILRV